MVLSSTMRRAVETAEIIAEGLAVPVQTLEGLCERTPGECEGMTHDEYRARYGREPWHNWVRSLSPGGESDEEFVARVRGVIGGFAERTGARRPGSCATAASSRRRLRS